jgi:glutathione reductase (NADPH)
MAINSDSFFDLEQQPKRAVVIGGGYIAVELAGVLQALGTEVTLVVRGERALKNFDDLICATLAEEMDKAGIKVRGPARTAVIRAAPVAVECASEAASRVRWSVPACASSLPLLLSASRRLC